jgi:flavin-dependent dehydrogenase
LIVGGGPAGSATAIGLARAGHRVRLLDRATFPREKPCSEYMSPEAVRHLDALGVLPTLDAMHGTPLEGTRVIAREHRLTGRFAQAGGTPFRPTGLALPRRLLDQTLLQAARDAGAEVVTGERVTALLHTQGAVAGVMTTDAQGRPREHRARVVVGADGLGSVVARRAGLHRQGWLQRIAFVAHVRDVRDMGRTAELHVGRAGYVGLNPIGDGVTNVALVVPLAVARGARGDVTAFLEQQLATFPGVAGRVDLRGMVREVLTTGPFHASCRRSVSDGLLLVGDAADFFDPFTGEGICTALTGAALATTTLHAALAHHGIITARHLASYRTARRQAFLGKWLIERLIGYSMLAPRLFDRAVGRLERRGMADTLIGVTGDFVSPWKVLNPVFLTRMVL